MSKLEIIDQTLLQQVVNGAVSAPRLRRNYNFHLDNSDACHRLLNAMEPDSYIPPHCHQDASKDETILALKGKFGLVLFGQGGEVTRTVVLQAGGEVLGINIPHGQFHSLVALESGGVFFESKAGPYQPLMTEEKALWAPEENTPDAAVYLNQLKALFATQ